MLNRVTTCNKLFVMFLIRLRNRDGIYRPFKRKIESSVKKAQAAQLVLEDIAKNYQDASKAAKFRGCASVRVKRQLANSSPKNCAG